MQAVDAPPASTEPELAEQAVRRAQAGVRADREALVLRYQRPVFAVLSRMLLPRGRGAQIDDLAQDTFARVFGALARFDPAGEARLSTWILTIATRLALDELAKARNVPAAADRLHVVADRAGERAAEIGAWRPTILRALAALEPAQQAVLVLRECHDLDYVEIAQALRIDIGTVKSRLSRARAALREAVRDTEEGLR